MASRGRGARAKGANFERYLGHYISDNTPLSARRGLAQTRGGGAEVSDVEVDYIHIEAKRQKRCSIKAAMDQAINDSTSSGKIPVVITKDDRKPIMCTMLMDDWLLFFNSYINQQTMTDVQEHSNK